MSDKNSFEHDLQARTRAGTTAALRGVVSLYLLYLAWQLIKDARSGQEDIPTAVAYLAAAVFALVAIGFAVYIVKRWRADVKASRPSGNDEKEGDKDEPLS